jgi:hypothetical protein
VLVCIDLSSKKELGRGTNGVKRTVWPSRKSIASRPTGTQGPRAVSGLASRSLSEYVQKMNLFPLGRTLSSDELCCQLCNDLEIVNIRP